MAALSNRYKNIHWPPWQVNCTEPASSLSGDHCWFSQTGDIDQDLQWQEASAHGWDWWKISGAGGIQRLHKRVSGRSERRMLLFITWSRKQRLRLMRTRRTTLTTWWTWNVRGKSESMRGWRELCGSPASSSAGLWLPLSPSMLSLQSSPVILNLLLRTSCDHQNQPFDFSIPLPDPNTHSSPFRRMPKIFCKTHENLIFTFSEVTMASGAYKKAFTGLTGMAVSRNPTHTLGVLYRFPSILLSHLRIIFGWRLKDLFLARTCALWPRCLQTSRTGSIVQTQGFFPYYM